MLVRALAAACERLNAIRTRIAFAYRHMRVRLRIITFAVWAVVLCTVFGARGRVVCCSPRRVGATMTDGRTDGRTKRTRRIAESARVVEVGDGAEETTGERMLL